VWKRRGGEGGGEGSRSKVCLFDRESTPETYRVWTRTGFGGGPLATMTTGRATLGVPELRAYRVLGR